MARVDDSSNDRTDDSFEMISRLEITAQDKKLKKLKNFNALLNSFGKPSVEVNDPLFEDALTKWKAHVSRVENRPEEKEMRWYHIVPFINSLYDMFVDEPLDATQLKELLTMLALVAALILSVAGSIPGMTSFQEIQDALGRFSLKNDISWSFCSQTSFNSAPSLEHQRYKTRCNRIFRLKNSYASQPFKDPHKYINSLGNYVNASIALLSMSILGTVLIYVAFVITSFEASFTIVEESLRQKQSKKMYSVWWTYVRVSLVYAVICLIAGIACFFFALHRVIIIKFPSVVVEEKNAQTYFSFEPLYQLEIWVFAGIIPASCMVVFISSVALYKKNLVFFKQPNKLDDNDVMTQSDNIEMKA